MSKDRYLQAGLAAGLLTGALAGLFFALLEIPFSTYTVAGNALLIEALRTIVPGEVASLADRPYPLFLLYALSGALAGGALGLLVQIAAAAFRISPGRRTRFRIPLTTLATFLLFFYPAVMVRTLQVPPRMWQPLWVAFFLAALLLATGVGWLAGRLLPLREPVRSRRIPVLVFSGLLVLFALTIVTENRARRASLIDYPTFGEPSHKIILFAVDGIDWPTIKPLLGTGDLPNLDRLIANGSCGVLRSLLPPIESPVVWTSVATSRRPEDHGIQGFITESSQPGRFIPVTNKHRLQPTFWEIIGSLGLTVDLLSWYPSWPVDSIPGIMLSDRATYPNVTGRVFPEQLEPVLDTLLTDFRSRLPALRLDLTSYVPDEDEDDLGSNGPAALRRFDMYILDQSYLRDLVTSALARRIMRKRQPDLLTVYFRGTDTVQHEFRKYHAARNDPWLASRLFEMTDQEMGFFGDIVNAYLRYVDREIGSILDLSGENTAVLLVSDHASGYSYDRQSHLQEGRLLRLLGWAKGEGNRIDRAGSKVVAHWDKAKTNSLRIHVNLVGRHTSGTVSRTEYEKLIAQMLDRLGGLRTTGGDAVFSSVEMGKRAGTRYSNGDLVCRINAGAVGGEIAIGDSLVAITEEVARFSRSGNHRMGGVFVLAGTPSNQGGRVRGATVYDVVPTLFHLMGLPLSLAWEGKPILDALDGEWRHGRPVRYVRSYDGTGGGSGHAAEGSGGEESVMEELRALGYID